MSVKRRNNVHVSGSGEHTMFFAHGFGCDQNMWRRLAPAYASRYRVVLFDLVGCGQSDRSAYDLRKYDALDAYATDLLEIVEEFGHGKAIYVGHSVSAMIGMLANIRRPDLFAAQIMIGPSPCFLNDGDYIGGLTRRDVESLLETLDSDYLGWAKKMAPTIMGAPQEPELRHELLDSFCSLDPQHAKHFARVTFLSDVRDEVPKLLAPTLIIQSDDDAIAPRTVGEYLRSAIPHSSLAVVSNIGHCPHLSAPGASSASINGFLLQHGL